jgi:hypothetical protein
MSDNLIIYEDMWRDKFNAAIAARLSASPRLRSRTLSLTGGELWAIYLDKVPGQSLSSVSQFDGLIILDLGIEPKNQYLFETLIYLIDDRLRWHRPTVINSRYPIASDKFRSMYSAVLADFLIDASYPKAPAEPIDLDLSDFCIRD